MPVSYTKTEWVDNSLPAINANNLNKIEQGIYDACEEINEVETATIPIVRGGTGATTAANARSNLGLSNAMSMVLLWTNPNPTQSYGAKTLNVDFSSYDFAGVIFRESTSTAKHTDLRVYKKNSPGKMAYQGSALLERSFSWSSNKIVWSNGKQISTGEDDSTILIPMYVYGIKIL